MTDWEQEPMGQYNKENEMYKYILILILAISPFTYADNPQSKMEETSKSFLQKYNEEKAKSAKEHEEAALIEGSDEWWAAKIAREEAESRQRLKEQAEQRYQNEINDYVNQLKAEGYVVDESDLPEGKECVPVWDYMSDDGCARAYYRCNDPEVSEYNKQGSCRKIDSNSIFCNSVVPGVCRIVKPLSRKEIRERQRQARLAQEESKTYEEWAREREFFEGIMNTEVARGKAILESDLSEGAQCVPIWVNGFCTDAYNKCNDINLVDTQRESHCSRLSDCGKPFEGYCQARN